jgi:xyloglucan-specific endo-beta-1,4-glucanase
MAFFSKILLLVSSFSAVYTTPVERSEASTCETGGWLSAGPYQLLADQWGAGGASGSQCVHLIDGDTLAWYTSWEWTGSGVKSFANVQLNSGVGQQLSAISSMPSTWKWSQSPTTGIVANVAYDMFTSSSPYGPKMDEIMVWLGDFNSPGPLSEKYTKTGQPYVIAADVEIEGHTWNLYRGTNNGWKAWSFLPTNGATITYFSGDIKQFFEYLTSHGYISSSQYLTTAQGGIEVASGSAKFTTYAYSLQIE